MNESRIRKGRTTIEISRKLRKELKKLAADKEMTYEQLLWEMLEVYLSKK